MPNAYVQYNVSKGKGQSERPGTLEISVIEDPIYDLVLIVEQKLLLPSSRLLMFFRYY